MTARNLLMQGGPGIIPEVFWVSTATSSGNYSDYAGCVIYSSISDCFYFLATSNDSAGKLKGCIRKIDKNTGEFSSALTITPSGLYSNTMVYGLAEGSDGSIYFTYNSTGKRSLYKVNSNLSKVWNYYMTSGNVFGNVKVDSTGNIYVYGQSGGSNGKVGIAVLKVDSAGTILLKKLVQTTGSIAYDSMYGLDLDSSGNIYVTTQTWVSPGSTSEINIHKLGSTGASIWAKSLKITATSTNLSSIVFKGSSVYIAATINSKGFLVKYDSNGNLVWQRSLDGTTYTCLAVDDSENLYIGGVGVIVCYNSSGALQYQRTISGINDCVGIFLTDKFLLLSGRTATDVFLFKLPLIPQSGTYGSISISNRTSVEAAGTATSTDITATIQDLPTVQATDTDSSFGGSNLFPTNTVNII